MRTLDISISYQSTDMSNWEENNLATFPVPEPISITFPGLVKISPEYSCNTRNHSPNVATCGTFLNRTLSNDTTYKSTQTRTNTIIPHPTYISIKKVMGEV